MMPSDAVRRKQIVASALLALGMAVTVGTALGFQHLGGYIPCALCLEQRLPYYGAIPVAMLALLASALGAPSRVTRLLLAICGIMMLVGAGLGVFHAGVEWHFWAGPTSCSTSAGGVTTNAGDLLGDLNSIKGPSCTDAALRVLGLSFAGWNVIASLVLAAIAVFGMRARPA